MQPAEMEQNCSEKRSLPAWSITDQWFNPFLISDEAAQTPPMMPWSKIDDPEPLGNRSGSPVIWRTDFLNSMTIDGPTTLGGIQLFNPIHNTTSSIKCWR